MERISDPPSTPLPWNGTPPAGRQGVGNLSGKCPPIGTHTISWSGIERLDTIPLQRVRGGKLPVSWNDVGCFRYHAYQ